MQLNEYITEELVEDSVDKVKSQLRNKVILAAGDSSQTELLCFAEGIQSALNIIATSHNLDTAIMAMTAMKLCVIESADRH